MAKRGTTKRLSVEQEKYIASLYRGRRSPSSGAAETDAGDVRTPTYLIEVKMTGNPGEVKRKSKILKDLEKVWAEAVAEDRLPALCLRYFQPNSPLSDRDGWVDLTVIPSDQHATLIEDANKWYHHLEHQVIEYGVSTKGGKWPYPCTRCEFE